MIKIINNADDFGYSRAVNHAIIDSYILGALTSTTIMANMPGFDHAVQLAKNNPILAIGVHLTLTCGFPILSTHKTIVENDGQFRNRSFFLDDSTSIDENEVYLEWKAQIEKVIKSGINPTHLDSHHHSHTYKSNLNVIQKLSKEYKIPVRNSYTVRLQEQGQDKKVVYGIPDNGSKLYHSLGLLCNDILIDPWAAKPTIQNNKTSIVETVINVLKSNTELSVIEVMWHPAYVDKNLYEGSSFHLPRMYEYEALLDKKYIAYLQDNAQLCTYRDI